MNADKNRAEKLIQSSQGRAPVGALVLRALPALPICGHLRPSAVKLFQRHRSGLEVHFQPRGPAAQKRRTVARPPLVLK